MSSARSHAARGRHETAGRLPERIACLTPETAETLYLLGEEDRIAGISGYTVRPARARKEKPRIGAFTTARVDRILALEPDLVLGFSDLQADLAGELIRAGLPVLVFNQRSVGGILNMMVTLGHLVGAGGRANALAAELAAGVERVRRAARHLPRRPRIYFEEWPDPMIAGVRWVSQLIEAAGGEDCFAHLAVHADARRRVIGDPDEVIARAPDIIIGSWCGRRFRPEEVAARPGWHRIPAVRDGHLYEIKSAEILQPGPGALRDGLDRLHRIVLRWQGVH